MSVQSVVAQMFPAIEWREDYGIIECPGKHFHMTRSTSRDCRVYIDGPPTIFCLHQSCRPVIEEANYNLRLACWKDEQGNPVDWKPKELPDDIKAKISRDIQKKHLAERLKEQAHKAQGEILSVFKMPVLEFAAASPCRCPKDDAEQEAMAWQLLIAMFPEEGLVWTGDVMDSGMEKHKDNFKPASQWLKPAGNYICPSVFKEGSFSRSQENILSKPFLVVESDVLSRDEIVGVFRLLQSVMRLRAVITTGGKSLHGWFDYPKSTILLECLKIFLPALGCDPSLFRPAQPVRCPGIRRQGTNIMQKLIWLDWK